MFSSVVIASAFSWSLALHCKKAEWRISTSCRVRLLSADLSVKHEDSTRVVYKKSGGAVFNKAKVRQERNVQGCLSCIRRAHKFGFGAGECNSLLIFCGSTNKESDSNGHWAAVGSIWTPIWIRVRKERRRVNNRCLHTMILHGAWSRRQDHWKVITWVFAPVNQAIVTCSVQVGKNMFICLIIYCRRICRLLRTIYPGVLPPTRKCMSSPVAAQ